MPEITIDIPADIAERVAASPHRGQLMAALDKMYREA